MKKTLLILFSLFFLLMQVSTACTTFFINKNGQLIFGRNYDWVSGAGIVCSNQKGLEKISAKMEDGHTIKWVSRYGSISFNQFGKEFPTGGMNEKGLIVELMWLDGTEYPKEDNRPALSVLQWIQYQLDNSETIEQVINTDSMVRISIHNEPLHYLIADASGNAATIEFINGRMTVHKGKDLPFPVLTNNTYSSSAKATVNAANNNNPYFSDNSLQRFATACSMVQQFRQNKINKPVVDYAFDILHDVAQGSFTKWSVVYDLRNKKIFFRTVNYPDVKSIDFNSFDFNCRSSSKVINMNQPMKGAIDKNFIPFDEALNRAIIEKAVDESRERIQISDKSKQANIDYSRTIKCER